MFGIDIPLFNSANFFTLLLKFGINAVAIFVVVRLIYFRIRQNRSYLFTLTIFNVIIFFVCALLSNLTLSMGFSFGIFAIFSILRYRTISIPIKEMTYLFIAITLAVINSLGNQATSLSEILFTNIAIIGITALLEKVWMRNEGVKFVIYEKIELIKPEFREQLLGDLRDRTGLPIHRLETGKIDFLKDTVELRVYFYASSGDTYSAEGDSDDDD